MNTYYVPDTLSDNPHSQVKKGTLILHCQCGHRVSKRVQSLWQNGDQNQVCQTPKSFSALFSLTLVKRTEHVSPALCLLGIQRLTEDIKFQKMSLFVLHAVLSLYLCFHLPFSKHLLGLFYFTQLTLLAKTISSFGNMYPQLWITGRTIWKEYKMKEIFFNRPHKRTI